MKQILMVLVLLFLAGCATAPGTDKQTIETGEGQVTVEGMTPATGEWCQAGANWQWTGTESQGDTTAAWKIDKLMTSGKYSGLCHVIYTAKTPQGDLKMDYYFDQSGENGYVEMEAGGQKISQEWHKE
jgi:hypothetical protein